MPALHAIQTAAPDAAQLKPPLEFSTAALVNISGASERQLQWWDEHNVVTPLHVGHRRVYTLRQAVLTLIVNQLRRNYSLHRIKRIVAGIGKAPQFHSGIDQGTDLFLLVGKETARFATSEQMALRDIVMQGESFSVLAIHELVDVLKACSDPMAKGRR